MYSDQQTTERDDAIGGSTAAATEPALAGRACGTRHAWREELVTRMFAAFGRRELATEATLALAHPDIVFEPMTAEVTQAGEPYRGHDGIRRYQEDLAAYWTRLDIRLTQVRGAGHAVVALGLVSGRGPAGAFADVPATWVVKFRDGLVAHVQVFSDERHVRQALLGEEACEQAAAAC